MKLPPSFFKTELWRSLDIWEQGLLMFLINHIGRGKNECWPSHGYIMKHLSIGRSKLLASLSKLETIGILKRTPPKYRGCSETTHYQIVLPHNTIQEVNNVTGQ
jgi:hypothetical protein